MKVQDLHERTHTAAALGAPVTLLHGEAEALLEVVEAARQMFEATMDRNVARRRMERLQVALAKLELR